MSGERGVTVFTGVVNAAALHFYGDNVERTLIVAAASLRVEINSAHFGKF
jgi:hypothetical protein